MITGKCPQGNVTLGNACGETSYNAILTCWLNKRTSNTQNITYVSPVPSSPTTNIFMMIFIVLNLNWYSLKAIRETLCGSCRNISSSVKWTFPKNYFFGNLYSIVRLVPKFSKVPLLSKMLFQHLAFPRPSLPPSREKIDRTYIRIFYYNNY